MQKEDLKTLETVREALAKITADKAVFDKMIEAYEKEDIKGLEGIVKKFDYPIIICRVLVRFICWVVYVIKCVRVCILICK